jgi:two-component system chemotaxis response regulator CheB
LRTVDRLDTPEGVDRPFKPTGKQYKVVAIGTSTGGPVALQTIITALPANFPLPILLVQHMPAAFTGAFAARLNTLAKIEVKEAADGDVLRPGVAYLAPGGKQMLLEGSDSHCKLRIKEDDSPRITFKPSVDITFGSAAKVFQDKVLAVVLTGMGSDGRDGSRLLKQFGSRIWAQDEASSVVYGMPQAVTVAGLTDVEVGLADVAAKLISEVGNG